MYSSYKVILQPDGTADYGQLWPLQARCDAGFVGFKGAVEPVAPLQRAVIEMARQAGYSDSDAESLYHVYQYCGSNDPDDFYASPGTSGYAPAHVMELKAWMTLCPNHPQAAVWRAGIEAVAKSIAAEKAGTRVYDGTYLVPSEMQRGTFVAMDVKDCYWETRGASGQILANNFILAAPRVEAKVSTSAVVFTSRGCGQWDRK